MVREEGIEPSNPYGYRILSPVRLPISPLPPERLSSLVKQFSGKAAASERPRRTLLRTLRP